MEKYGHSPSDVQYISRGNFPEAARGRTLTSILATIALVLILAPPTSAQAQDPCLGNILITVEHLQSGVAGQTGVRTTISEDGCFTVDHVVNDKTVSRLRSGQLSPDRIASTRAAIEAMPEGCVAVADAMGITDAGIFGDILCARMAKRGVAALVTDGVMLLKGN